MKEHIKLKLTKRPIYIRVDII